MASYKVVTSYFSTFTQAKLNAVAREMNDRPRKTLGYETPAERYRQTVASIS
jgi:transposase, IS30 family